MKSVVVAQMRERLLEQLQAQFPAGEEETEGVPDIISMALSAGRPAPCRHCLPLSTFLGHQSSICISRSRFRHILHIIIL